MFALAVRRTERSLLPREIPSTRFREYSLDGSSPDLAREVEWLSLSVTA